MANYVKFQRGSEQAYKNLVEKNFNTLYFVYDPVDSTKAKLYLGDKLLSGVGEGTGVTSLAQLEEVIIEGVPSAGSFLVCNSEGKWVNQSLESVIALIAQEKSLGFEVDTKVFKFDPVANGAVQKLELLGFAEAEAEAIPFKAVDGSLNWGTPQIITSITGRLDDMEQDLEDFTANLEGVVEEKIAELNHLTFKKVENMDQVTDNNTIYLVPNPDSEIKNAYLEYLVFDGQPELIGDLNTGEISLDGYATVEALQSVAGNLAVVSEKVGKLENDYTKVNSDITNIKTAVGDITKLYDYETNARTIVDELNDINERLMWEDIPT